MASLVTRILLWTELFWLNTSMLLWSVVKWFRVVFDASHFIAQLEFQLFRPKNLWEAINENSFHVHRFLIRWKRIQVCLEIKPKRNETTLTRFLFAHQNLFKNRKKRNNSVLDTGCSSHRPEREFLTGINFNFFGGVKINHVEHLPL